jgi:hypothetical protein
VVQRYRKKPVVIEAVQVPTYDPENVVVFVDECIALADWCGGVSRMMNEDDEHGGPHIDIETMEGTMRADSGDWIIRGVAGEFYPCKPHIFEATYEPVT